MDNLSVDGLILEKHRLGKMRNKLADAWEKMCENGDDNASVSKDVLRDVIDWLSTEFSMKKADLNLILSDGEKVKRMMALKLFDDQD